MYSFSDPKTTWLYFFVCVCMMCVRLSIFIFCYISILVSLKVRFHVHSSCTQTHILLTISLRYEKEHQQQSEKAYRVANVIFHSVSAFTHHFLSFSLTTIVFCVVCVWCVVGHNETHNWPRNNLHTCTVLSDYTLYTFFRCYIRAAKTKKSYDEREKQNKKLLFYSATTKMRA